jgi:hypothetical protein
MIQSRPLELNGRFVGVAVNAATDWHFVAVDPLLDDLDGARFPNPEEMVRVARLVLDRAQRTRQPGLALPAPVGSGRAA